MKKQLLAVFVPLLFASFASAQVVDTVPRPLIDSTLRIINLNTNFSQHVDSSFVYQFRINKVSKEYFWQLKDAPVGLTINKDNGTLVFKSAKNYFLSGKLKYDYPYKVNLVVQSLLDEKERADTFFNISFYNTEITPSRIKLTVSGPLTVDEGEAVSFRVQCETGTFPFESVLFSSTVPIKDYKLVTLCNDEFNWTPSFDFVKEADPAKERSLTLSFTGVTRFQQKDTVSVKLIVKNALNYPQAKEEFELVNKNIRIYVLQLKYAFLQVDKKLKRVKNTRTVFDLTSASTALTGTILNTSSSESAQKTGKVLPSVGVALVPIKEATSPNKAVEQNQASQIRTAIKRLEYMLTDNVLVGDKDIDIQKKINKLKEELKQAQVQLIDIPVEISGDLTEEELNNYFNSPKVNKKYRLSKKKN